MITRPFLLLSLVAASLGAAAAVEVPLYLAENFREMGEKYDYPAEGWRSFGIDAEPDASLGMNQFFNPAESAYSLMSLGNLTAAMSCTNWTPSQASDEWLVSPEFKVDSDDAVLHFTTVSYTHNGSWGVGSAPFEVLVSETGPARDDFVSLYYNSVSAQAAGEYSSRDFYVNLAGYGGKSVRLAFRQTAENVGPMGFTDIQLGRYYCRVDNLSETVLEEGDPVTVDLNVYMKTAVACSGFTAKVYIDDELKGSQHFNKNLGGNIPQPQRVTLSDLGLAGSQALSYRVDLTPDLEGALPTVVTGVFGIPVTSYLNNVVLEEWTATGCMYCPPGAASMAYYKENYPGSESMGKFIGIAIHGYVSYADPMSEGVSGYLNSTQKSAGTADYPGGVFNRNGLGVNPWNKSVLEKEMALTSMNKVEISSVEYPELSDEDDIYGSTVTVTARGWNAYSASELPLNASVVLIENNVKGYDPGYNQKNAIYNFAESTVINNYGEWILPYMRPYMSGGKWGQSTIRFSDIEYQHVARGVWPSYEGMAVTGPWEADSPREIQLEFKVPDYVIDWKNTEVIVLLTDPASGRIVASDIIPYSGYSSSKSGVGAIESPAAPDIYYNLQGIPSAAPGKGVNIVRHADGSVSKILR